jgi:hypothetical protein
MYSDLMSLDKKNNNIFFAAVPAAYYFESAHVSAHMLIGPPLLIYY